MMVAGALFGYDNGITGGVIAMPVRMMLCMCMQPWAPDCGHLTLQGWEVQACWCQTGQDCSSDTASILPAASNLC